MDLVSNHLLVLVNPKAGAGGGANLVRALQVALRRRDFEVEVTDSLVDLEQRVQALDERCGAIVSVGGDGTAEAAVEATGARVPLAVFPLGTENLLAKYLGLRAEPEEFAEMMRSGQLRDFDVGKANGKIFLLMLSCGFDADVVRRLHLGRRGNISHLAYALPMLDAIRHYDYPKLRVSWETTAGWEEQQCHWTFCFNAPAYAAGLRIVPDADPADGKLDVATFSGGSFWHGLRQFTAVVTGRHRGMPEFRQIRTQRLRIDSVADRVPYQMDGDPGGFLPVEIELLARHLRLIVPASP